MCTFWQLNAFNYIFVWYFFFFFFFSYFWPPSRVDDNVLLLHCWDMGQQRCAETSQDTVLTQCAQGNNMHELRGFKGVVQHFGELHFLLSFTNTMWKWQFVVLGGLFDNFLANNRKVCVFMESCRLSEVAKFGIIKPVQKHILKSVLPGHIWQ